MGYKHTMVIEYPSLMPVAFLFHQGSPSDAKLYEEILEELKRRRNRVLIVDSTDVSLDLNWFRKKDNQG